MLKFINKKIQKNNKEETIISPVDGKVIQITDIDDKVFSQKIMGDGVAIEPTGNVFKAPADGELTMIFETNHAFAMTLDSKVEVLVHIGLDTVKLNGEGFSRLANVGDKVKKGQPIIKIDKDKIEKEGYSLVTPVLIINMDCLESMQCNCIGKNVEAGRDVVCNIKVK